MAQKKPQCVRDILKGLAPEETSMASPSIEESSTAHRNPQWPRGMPNGLEESSMTSSPQWPKGILNGLRVSSITKRISLPILHTQFL